MAWGQTARGCSPPAIRAKLRHCGCRETLAELETRPLALLARFDETPTPALVDRPSVCART
jgi:hypothetical protein